MKKKREIHEKTCNSWKNVQFMKKRWNSWKSARIHSRKRTWNSSNSVGNPFACTNTWKNYTSVDPKQFTVNTFRLKPVILISECFCSRCGHTNQHPPPTWRETTGDNGRQDHFRAQEADHTNQHPPPHMKGDNRRQRETRPFQSLRWRPHQPTPTPTWREKTRDNGRQRETRPLQSPRSRPHQPTPAPHMRETTGDNGRQRATRPLQSPRSRPHQPTPNPQMKGDRLKPVILISECFCSRCGHTNQHPPTTWRETTGDNGRQDHFRAQEADHTNQHPPPTWRETTGDNGRQDHFRA